MTQAQFTIEEIPFFDPIKIANSGQCFRWKILDASHVELVALGRYLQITYLGSERFAFSCPRSEFNDLWYNYLDLARDYHQVADCILPDDTYLREALAFGEGIRILNQDPFETLICFIISQRRSIPSITTCVERLCALAGRKIDLPLASLESQELFVNLPEENYFAFPNCEEILKLTPEQYKLAKFYFGIAYMSEYEELLEPVDYIRENRISSYFTFTLEPYEGVTFVSTTYAQPRVNEFNDYRLCNETSLNLGITKKLTLSTTFNYNYDAAPPEGVPTSTYYFINGLELEF